MININTVRIGNLGSLLRVLYPTGKYDVFDEKSCNDINFGVMACTEASIFSLFYVGMNIIKFRYANRKISCMQVPHFPLWVSYYWDQHVSATISLSLCANRNMYVEYVQICICIWSLYKISSSAYEHVCCALVFLAFQWSCKYCRPLKNVYLLVPVVHQGTLGNQFSPGLSVFCKLFNFTPRCLHSS